MTQDTDDRPLVRCAIYTRQSVAKTGSDPALASCAIQRKLCTDFIKSMLWRGWYVANERFDDEGYSGSTTARPALRRLVQQIRAGKIQRVIVYRLDRFTRRLADWTKLAELLQEHSVGLTVVAGAIDVESGAMARLQLNLLATFAELEREMIGERLADARAARKARGLRAAGRVPLGYTTNPMTKQLVVQGTEAAVVRWFFEAAAKGRPTGELVEDANRSSIRGKAGKHTRWSPRAVLRLLQNPTYAGQRPDGSPAGHQPLVPAELFDQVQQAIANRKTKEHFRRQRIQPLLDPFILRGIVECELCGKTMTTSMSGAFDPRTAKSAPRYYRCRTPGCKGGQVAAEIIEAQAFEALCRPHPRWPERTVASMAQYASVWHVVTPHLRGLTLTQAFERLTWRPGTKRLLVKGRTDWTEIDAALAERKSRDGEQ